MSITALFAGRQALAENTFRKAGIILTKLKTYANIIYTVNGCHIPYKPGRV